MPPERFPAHDPREWLGRARGNLARAKATRPDYYLEDLCFDAQQAAEKAIKAVFVRRGIRFPYTHDLADLLTLLEQSGEPVPAPVAEAPYLTPFAVFTRYPRVGGPVTVDRYERAVAIAEAVVRWAEGQIGADQESTDGNT